MRLSIAIKNDTSASSGVNAPFAGLLAARWRADFGISQATGVNRWEDLSGNFRPQLQTTGSKQPAWSATGGPNGRPCITGDGATQVMKAAFTLNQPCTIYAVAKYTGAFAHNETLFDGGGGTGNRGRFYRSAANTMNMTAGIGPITGTVSTSTAWHYYRVDVNAASSAVYQDGVSKFSGDAGVGALGGLTLFAFGDGVSDVAAASLAEMVVLGAVPSSTQDATILAYLRSWYQLP